MIFGVGVDILDPERLKSTLSPDDPFIMRTFTEAERAAAPKEGRARLEFFSGRFSIKEAVFKALSDDASAARLNEIEIRSAENGAPYVILYGGVKERAEQKGIGRVHVSLSKEKNCVCAFAVASLEGR